jgi:hypothetical protein
VYIQIDPNSFIAREKRKSKVRNIVMYDKFKNVGKIVKNSCGPIITNRGSFSFFENRDICCLLPQVRKSILR